MTTNSTITPELLANAAHPLALLRPRRDRPCRHAAKKRDELAPLQLTKLHALTLAKVTA